MPATMGTLGDRIGRRKLLLMGAAAFAGLCGGRFSVSPAMLIVARALLGMVGASLLPSTLALIRTLFDDERERAVAFGVWVAVFTSGGAIGPVVGGALLERFWWGAVFLLGVPAMVLLLVLGPVLLPESRDPNPGRLDLASTAMSLAAVLGIVYGLKRIAVDGPDAVAVLAVLAGLAVGAVFLRRQRSLTHPQLVGGAPEQIVLGNSTSHGLHLIANGLTWSSGDEVLTVEGDYPATVLPWQVVKASGL